jgi:hypothetical protein
MNLLYDMGLFRRKREKIVDWSEKYKIQQKRNDSSTQKDTSNLEFLGDLASASNSSNDYALNEREEKKNKLSKRLLDMTNRIEDLSNQIYHLKQRVELLEKKLKISFE